MGGVIDPWLVAGSSLYWAAVVFSFAFDGVSISPAAEPSSAVLAYVLVALMLLCFIPIRQVFERRRSRQMVALTMALVVGVYTATSSLATVPRIASGIVSLAYLAEVACQMVLWGFAYASLDKSRACQNVCCTMLVVVTLVSLSSILYKLTETCCLTCLLNIASLLVIASGRVFFSSHDRAASGDIQRPLAFFVISRVFFGAFMGFCIQLPKGPGIADSSMPMTILAILICCGMLLFFILSRYPLGAFMPVTLVTGVVLLYLPHANEGLRALVSSAAGLTWLAWATMSAVQLSDFKETCGFREFTLCAIEKSVLSLSIVAGSLLSPLVHWGTLEGSGEQVAQAVIIGALCALVLLATFVMSLLLDYRQQDELARRFEMENRELSSALYREIAREFKLSDRELQIMALLAEGYSRTYIRDSLGVSEGTIKAHVSHIYQKIGIHRKDDLLDLVESRRS